MGVVLEIEGRVFTAEELSLLLAKYQMLPKLGQEIILDRAVDSIICTEEEKAQAYELLCQQYQLASEEQIQHWLDRHGMTKEQLEALAVKKIKIEKYKEEHWGNKVEAYFIKRKSQLDRVVYSLIRTDKAELAQELYFRIQEGESTFQQLAMDYSEGTEAQTGGLIGPVEVNAPHPRIAQVLSTCKPGQLVPPTRVGEWIVIIRLENFISAKLDETMRQRMLDEMFRQWLNEQTEKKLSFFPSPVIS
jgi:parvulin-like peptidyl-prolyl isomerase